MNEPFQRLPKEGAKAFAAFTTYLNLGPPRSLAAVGGALGKSESLIERWSRRYGWSERARAYDGHMARVAQEAEEATARAKADEWTRRQEPVRDREWALHEACMRVAEEALKRFLENARRGATLGDIARLIEVGSKMGRLASGMATDRTEVTTEHGGSVQLELTAALNKVYGDLTQAAGHPGAWKPLDDRQMALLPPIDVVPLPAKPGEGGQS
jgi:hypothetical protein